jgi:hypothetical protein
MPAYGGGGDVGLPTVPGVTRTDRILADLDQLLDSVLPDDHPDAADKWMRHGEAGTDVDPRLERLTPVEREAYHVIRSLTVAAPLSPGRSTRLPVSDADALDAVRRLAAVLREEVTA